MHCRFSLLIVKTGNNVVSRIGNYNANSTSCIACYERILKPLDQDLILITAFKIKNKIKNRIGAREPGSIGEE